MESSIYMDIYIYTHIILCNCIISTNHYQPLLTSINHYFHHYQPLLIGLSLINHPTLGDPRRRAPCWRMPRRNSGDWRSLPRGSDPAEWHGTCGDFTMGKPWENHGKMVKNGENTGKPWENGNFMGKPWENMVISWGYSWIFPWDLMG